MKEAELRLYAICSMCQKPIGSTGLPLFWRVTVECFGIDAAPLRRQMGLTGLLGGSARLAMVMGTDEEMTQTLLEPVTLSICEGCALKQTIVASLAELRDVLEKKETADG